MTHCLVSTSPQPSRSSTWKARMWLIVMAVTTVCSLSSPTSAQTQMSPHGVSPHGQGGMGQLQISSFPDPNLPVGKIVVEVTSDEGRPLPGIKVQVMQQFQSVAQGNQNKAFTETSSASGTAEFADLESAMRFSYSVTVVREGAEYIVPAFGFGKMGQRVRVPTYPVTRDEKEALIGMRGFNYVQLRADVLKVDVMYRVLNLGKKTWIPQNVTIALPADAEAVDVGDNPELSGFKLLDEKVSLMGSYPPGAKDVQFTFQLPNSNTESRVIKLGVFPETAELRVLSELTPNLTLDVAPAFETPQLADGPAGNRVLITRRLMQPGEPPLSEVSIVLGGLPVTGPGRWVAILIALVILLVAVVGIIKGRPEDEVLEERKQAQETLLSEILLLERAFEAGEIGPRTFEQTKKAILSALARLEVESPA